MFYIIITVIVILIFYLIINADGKKRGIVEKNKEENRLTEVLRLNLSRSLDSMKHESKPDQNSILKGIAQRYAENDKKHHSNISLHNQFDKVKYVTYFSDTEYSLMIDRVTSKVLNEFIDPID